MLSTPCTSRQSVHIGTDSKHTWLLQALSLTLASLRLQTNLGGKGNTKEHEVWVRKWVDYSSKYGLGYYLSNDATGVFFNDSTKIVLDPNGYHFDYVERRTADRQDFCSKYNLAEYPKEL